MVLERQGRKGCKRISENTDLVTFKRGRAYYKENRTREIRIDSEGRECKKIQPSGISAERNLSRFRIQDFEETQEQHIKDLVRKAGFQEVQTKACSRDHGERERVVSKDIQKKDYHKLEGYKEGQGVTKID